MNLTTLFANNVENQIIFGEIKKPVHIIICSSCTCAPLYANMLSFNSQPVLWRFWFIHPLTGTFVLFFYLLFKFTYNPCILHNQIVYPADYLFLINPSWHIYLPIKEILIVHMILYLDKILHSFISSRRASCTNL